MLFNKNKSGSIEYLIVGLGNPGLEYEKTRHNVGFNCMDILCDELNITCNKAKFKGYIGDGKIGDKKCMFLKPLTYMNLSGESVVEAMQFYKIPPERVIVISDDISLDVGRMRIRGKGSAGGHNGLKNIIELSGSDEFPRVKIGVGKKPHPDYDLKDWVLGKFSSDDRKIIDEVLKKAAEAVQCIVTKGIDIAMGRFNN